MKRQSGALRIGFAIVAALCVADEASAVCVVMTPCREYERTPIILQGLVERVAPTEYEDQFHGRMAARLFHVKVERVWKGPKDTAEVDFVTLGTPGKLWVEDEFEFKIGERYVIWASPSNAPPALRTSGCSMTKPLRDAAEQLAFLDSLSRPSDGGYVYGQVFRLDSPSTADQVPRQAGLTVVLEAAGMRREARTDDEGRFRFTGLRAGRYDIYLVLPDTLAPMRQTPADPHYPRTEMPVRSSVEITGPRDCAEASFTVQSSGRMSGFTSTADGKPVTGVIVQAVHVGHLMQVDANRAKGAFAYLFSAKAITDHNGFFEFLNLPPGRYVVGVALEHDTSEDQPYPRIFYPGVGSLEEATPFDLQLGQHLDVGPFTLPSRLPRIAIEGIVVRENGEPAADVFVGLTNNWKARLPGTRTDKSGRFSTFVYPGYSYTMRATAGTGKDALVGEASCVVESDGARPEPLRIVLRPRGGDPRQ